MDISTPEVETPTLSRYNWHQSHPDVALYPRETENLTSRLAKTYKLAYPSFFASLPLIKLLLFLSSEHGSFLSSSLSWDKVLSVSRTYWIAFVLVLFPPPWHSYHWSQSSTHCCLITTRIRQLITQACFILRLYSIFRYIYGTIWSSIIHSAWTLKL